MKVLITAGATREPIDAVRFLSNVSTGATGAALAEVLGAAGHEVVLLRGGGAVKPKRICEQENFSSAADLAARLQRRLRGGEIDAVVMTAAVADFRPAEKKPGKISSEMRTMTLELVPNEKILPRLKSFSPRPLLVIGFKLTVGADDAARRAAVKAQFAAGGVDSIVHNDLTEIQKGALARHPFWLYRSAGDAPVKLTGARVLAAEIAGLIAMAESS